MQITTENIVEIFNNNSDHSFDKTSLKRVDWSWISRCQKLTEKFIERFAEHVDWSGISRCQKLSEKFIERFAERVDWYGISYSQKLSEKFIERFAERVDWSGISRCQKLSEKFIERFAERVNWSGISYIQKLTEKFIERFAERVDWYKIFRCQKLSEKFIERFAERVNWYGISRCQKLSEKFIERFAERVDWSGISCYQKLNRTFRTKFADKLQIPDASSNTLYWKIKQLKSLVASSPYKIINNEYIIAWKAICLDRTSLYNKLYTYEKGTIHTAHCDCNLNNESSFGLSAWTKEKAQEYGKSTEKQFKLVRVKIMIKDIGVILENHNWKIRARKLEVLS